MDSYKASNTCLANAQALLRDARALIRRGSFGRAIALAVLAEEEIGKSQLWGMRAIGIEIPDKILRRHEAKQLTKVLTFDFIELFLGEMLNGLLRAKREEDPKRREELVRRAIQRQGRKWKTLKPDEFLPNLQQEMSRLGAMSSTKEAGFYVDVDAEGHIRTPANFTKREAEQYLRGVEKRLTRFNQVWGDTPELTEENLEACRQWWQKAPESMRAGMSQFLQVLSGADRKMFTNLGSGIETRNDRTT